MRLTKMLARKAQNDALRRSDEQSYRLAATDPLTGLYNRRYAETYLAALPSQTDARRPEFCVLLVDLDYFKAVNDTHGHAAGDQVLREVAHRLRDNLRACDLIARYGGEEFLVVLPETSGATATLLAERLRCAINARDIRWPGGPPISVSVSIGVAAGSLASPFVGQRTGTCDTESVFASDFFQSTFEAADAALYRAKSNGRNRVEVSAGA
jgi:two-component system cell cycle response regulator